MKYTIRHVQLNRPTLVERRSELHKLQQTMILIEAELQRTDLDEQLRTAYANHLADIRKMI